MSNKTKPQPALLPDVIYVVRRKEGTEDLLFCFEQITDIEAGEIVGVYRCSDMRTKRVTHTIE